MDFPKDKLLPGTRILSRFRVKAVPIKSLSGGLAPSLPSFFSSFLLRKEQAEDLADYWKMTNPYHDIFVEEHTWISFDSGHTGYPIATLENIPLPGLL